MSVIKCNCSLLLGILVPLAAACIGAEDVANEGAEVVQHSEALTGIARYKIGVFRNGEWYLDRNDNGVWNGCETDVCGQFGQVGDLPIVGAWRAQDPNRITTSIGVYRPSDHTFYLDYNGDYDWDGCGIDKCYRNFLSTFQPGDRPVSLLSLTGSGEFLEGRSNIGIFRGGTWYIDTDFDGVWEASDKQVGFGQVGDVPVTGAWVSSFGVSHVGVFRSGNWYLDKDGDSRWDGCAIDFCSTTAFGNPTDLPFASSIASSIGVYRNPSSIYIDGDGDKTWDNCTVDHCLAFGSSGDVPVAGVWK